MRGPHFLVVGAMKAGTTTLYRDLLSQPAVHFPVDKEPSHLADDDVLRPVGRRRYLDQFSAARPDQAVGEASTDYTKLPTIAGVPQRAHAVLGGDLKVLYLVRHPVDRLRSHLEHERRRGDDRPAAQRIATDPAYLAYSSYGRQIRPWIEQFGAPQVRIVHFETYVRDRTETVADICRWLGVPSAPDLVPEHEVFNRADEPMVPGRWRNLLGYPLYVRLLRRHLDPELRRRIRQRLFTPRDARTPDPTLDATLARDCYDRLRPDLVEFADLTGFDVTVWDRPR